MRLTIPVGLALLAGTLVAAGAIHAQAPNQSQQQKCPVSGHEYTVDDKTPFVLVNGQKVTFCCASCPKAFAAQPEKYLTTVGKCPVQGEASKPDKAARVVINNNLYYTCCGGCPERLTKTPEKFVKQLKDPVSGKAFAPKAGSPRAVANGQLYVFESATSKATFEKEPVKYVVVYK